MNSDSWSNLEHFRRQLRTNVTCLATLGTHTKALRIYPRGARLAAQGLSGHPFAKTVRETSPVTGKAAQTLLPSLLLIIINCRLTVGIKN
jgi:hypothetical protein